MVPAPGGVRSPDQSHSPRESATRCSVLPGAMKTTGSLLLLLVPISTTPALSQESVARIPEAHQRTTESFELWSSRHGGGGHVDIDRFTGRANFLGGGTFSSEWVPRGDEDFFFLARRAIGATAGMTGIELQTLVDERVKFLPLGLIGTTDKMTVSFTQEVGGVPVLGGRVNVLFDLAGGVLSLQSTAIPGVGGLHTLPGLSADQARELAAAAFETETGLPATEVGEARLGIGWELVVDEKVGRLVWEVDATWHEPDFMPEGLRLWIDAQQGGAIQSFPTVHEYDVNGTVSTNTTPGTLPDTASNPPVLMPVKDMRVKTVTDTVYTDATGAFNFPGISGPEQVTAEFVGLWAHVDNIAGPEEVFVGQLSGTGNQILLNGTPTEAVTSQANVFIGIGLLRDWIRFLDPTDDTADFQAYAKVNHNSTCNAYFDYFSVNFFASGGSCPNTGFSTVIAHEMGHWLNELYYTYNGWDGMGEGNADVFCMYLYDTPIVGEDFLGPGTNVRDGNNNTMFCGDATPNCHGGEVHKEGEVWMGAAWKVRARLNTTLGNAAGDAVANGLFSAWMNGYDQEQIKSVIELQWLTLDDDDGNLDNGSPNYDDIDGGFRDQGFPGLEKPAILYDDVTILDNTADETGPYVVEATIIPQVSPVINSADLWYRIGDGDWTSIAMVPMGNDVFEAGIPGQSSVAEIYYYLSAADNLGNTLDFPEGGANDAIYFVVGLVENIYFDDFESPDDAGWTHGTFGDTPNSHDDFQHGSPAGLAGDPSSAFSGDRAWGNDLGEGAYNGAYQNQQHNWLRSPAIDCSDSTYTQLRFRRWLRVDASSSDKARVTVNGVEIWTNHELLPHFDNYWRLATLDISEVADGNPAVVVEFSLESDAMTTFGGWTIDDVELRSLAPVGGEVGTSYCFGDGSGTACPCSNPGSSTTGCANSTGSGASITGTGSTSVVGDDLAFQAEGMLPSQPGLMFVGLNAVNGGLGSHFGDGLRCAGGSIIRLGVRMADGAGTAQWGPALAGTGGWSSGDVRRFQLWYRDPGGSPCGNDFNLSHGVEVTFTP